MAHRKPLLNPTPADLVPLIQSELFSTKRPAPSGLLALWMHLPVVVQTPDGLRAVRSSLEASLKNCREATNRDGNTGTPLPPGVNGSWLGAMGYLALLDQIGNSVRHRKHPRAPSGKTGFEHALAHFSTITDDEAVCLYALRNSLAHDFSLVNVPPPRIKGARRKALTRLFTLSRGEPNLIRWPTRNWSPNNPRRTDATVVDVGHLGDLVEGVVHEVRRVYALDELRFQTAVVPTVWRRGHFFQHAP